jgi:DNA-binding CsgD family transcriptional regulator
MIQPNAVEIPIGSAQRSDAKPVLSLVATFPVGSARIVPSERLLSQETIAALTAAERVHPNHDILAEVWRGFERGALRVVSCFHDEEHYGLRLARSPASAGLTTEQSVLLKRYFRSGLQKVLSLDDGVSPSLVTTHLNTALSRIGLTCWPSRVPLLVVLASVAADGEAITGAERSWCEGGHEVVTLRSPRAWLAERLSPGEAAVAWLQVEGLTLQEIAARRGAARRTVANQIGTVHRKLGVSRRAELLKLLIDAYRRGLLG